MLLAHNDVAIGTRNAVREKIIDREKRQTALRAQRDRLNTLAKLPTLDTAGLAQELRQRLTD